MNESNTPIFLMSPPRRDWRLRGRANFRARRAGKVEAESARAEWASLADAIVDSGGEVLVCPPPQKSELTGMIYTAEAGEFFRDDAGQPSFLLPNMAVEHRRGEADWIGRFVEEDLGFETVRVAATWEAQGDAIRADSADKIVHTYGVGPEGRTDGDAYEEVADRLSPHHIQLRFEADPWFHGNTFLNVYRPPDPDRSPAVVVCPEALSEEGYARLVAFVGEATIHHISRQESLSYDTNALQVGSTILAPTSLSASTGAALEETGFEVCRLDLAELFGKGGGAPVCLTNRLWGLEREEVPDEFLWSAGWEQAL